MGFYFVAPTNGRWLNGWCVKQAARSYIVAQMRSLFCLQTWNSLEFIFIVIFGCETVRDVRLPQLGLLSGVRQLWVPLNGNDHFITTHMCFVPRNIVWLCQCAPRAVRLMFNSDRLVLHYCGVARTYFSLCWRIHCWRMITSSVASLNRLWMWIDAVKVKERR